MLERVAHYNLLELVGAGGMGEVYRARDTRLGRTVAVKVLPDTIVRDTARRERFLREARAAAAISHPNIATLFDVVEDGEDLFLVFEFVPGRTLAAEIGGRPMSTRVALELAVQLADAVADAHAAGIVHRDLKPENIVVTPKGRAKILDFGLATWTRGGAAREMAVTQLQTEPGVVMGTLAYMSPEQASGGPVDERSDIFSLGIVIFEMLTGRSPFARRGAGLLAAGAIVSEPAPAPSTVNRNLPPEVDPLLARALAKDPGERYQTAATLAAELRALLAILDVRSGDHDPMGTLPLREERSRSWGWLVVAIVVVALAAALWVWRDRLVTLWGRTTGPPPAPVIAVVAEPSGDGAQYVADGLADDVVTRLGQMPGLQVLGRSTTREYGGRPPGAVAAELGAKAVLTLSVRRASDTLRVDVGLLDPATGVQLWGEQYDRPVREVFAVQAEIATQVARALHVTLAPSAALARTSARLVDARAYDLYLRARDASARRDRLLAVQLFGEAVKADPNLAEAYAGLAEATYLEAVGAGNIYDPTLFERTRAAAMQAVALDPDLPHAHLALALGAERLTDSLAGLRRAIELDPSYAEAFHQIGDAVVGFDPVRALEFYQKALELDARLDVTWADAALAHLLLGDADGAREQIRRGRLANPTNEHVAVAEWLQALAAGDGGRAVDLATRIGDFTDPRAPVALTVPVARGLQLVGRAGEAVALLRARLAGAPAFCEGRALLGGLLIDVGDVREGVAMLMAVLADADAPGAPSAMARCAATAAAALGDADRTGAWLRRIAAREDTLRLWALEVAGATGDLPVRFREYPWGKVVGRPAVDGAMAEIQAGYGRLRAVAGDALAGVDVGSGR